GDVELPGGVRPPRLALQDGPGVPDRRVDAAADAQDQLARLAQHGVGVAHVELAVVGEVDGTAGARGRPVALDHRHRARLARLRPAAGPREPRDLVGRARGFGLPIAPAGEGGLALLADGRAVLALDLGRLAGGGRRGVLEQRLEAAGVIAAQHRVDQLVDDLARRPARRRPDAQLAAVGGAA